MKKIDEKVARISLDKLIENAEAGIISRPAYILNILKDVKTDLFSMHDL